jgi:hypothetical protein
MTLATFTHSVIMISSRYVPLHELGNKTPQQCSEDFAAWARIQVDPDEPTLANLQSMLLLSLTYYALGYGKKAFMQMGMGCSSGYINAVF